MDEHILPAAIAGDEAEALLGVEPFHFDPDDPRAAQLFPALRATQFRVENIGGEAKASAQMLDREGHLIAELVRNEWKVAPP